MPAGFNKGQIEYIKTIANVNGHKSYKSTTVANQQHQSTTGTQASNDSHLRYAIWNLGLRPKVFTPTATTTPVEDTTMTPLDVYHVAINTDQETATEAERVTPECFLESLRLKMRIMTNLDVTEDQHSHKEFRLVIFRHREKQNSTVQLASNFSNPLYDMFHGAQNTKYGVKGFRRKMDKQGNVDYQAWGAYVDLYDRDAMLTDPINKDDYIVAKDCRFYMGREYGGKHIFEDTQFWDFEDPIATDDDRIDQVDTEKNYCWYIWIGGVNNNVVAGGQNASVIDNLGYIRFNFNTHVTSG